MKNTALVPLTTCTKCMNFGTKPIPCADSWCRPEEWFCKHPDVREDKNKIDGYHNLTDKDPGIPNFCPFLSEDQKEKEPEYEFVDFDRGQIEMWMLKQLKEQGFTEINSIEEFCDDEGDFSFFQCKCPKR